MKSSNRDKFIKLLLPALAIALSYTAWTGVGKQKAFAAKQAEVAAKRAESDNIQKTAPLAIEQIRHQIREQELKFTQLSAKIEDLLKGQKAARDRWNVLAGNCHSAEERIQRIGSLTTLMKAHHLTLIADANAEGAKTAKLPQAVEKLGKLLGQANKSTAPEVRHYHFRGSYIDVHDLIVELSRGETVAIPLTVTMKPSERGNDVREWTLVVWI